MTTTTTQETEKSEYDLQAEKFLADTGTTLEIKFKAYAKHFHDDKEPRLCYTFKLIRGNRSYSGTFGESIAFTYSALTGSSFSVSGRKTLWEQELTDYAIKSIKPDGTFIKPKHSASGRIWATKREPLPLPSAYSILACLTKSDPDTFENFCSEFGYDDDSKKAEKIYQAVKEEWLGLAAMYNDDEMSLLQEIN